MTDLVLLRRGCCWQAVGDGSDNIEVDVLSTNALMQQAADEIEALRRRAELAEGELEVLNNSHRDLATRLADAGRKALAESQ